MKIVIVGLGIQGIKRQRIAGADVVATVDPVHPAAAYRTLEAVPVQSYDAALVCTPDDAKIPLITYLLTHKKHVLVEKPVLGKSEDITALLSIAEKNNVACYTAYNHRFEPHFIRVKNELESGSIGRPYLLRMFYGNGTARDVRNSPWRDAGMGILSDIGSHLLDTLHFWFGDKPITIHPWRLKNFENKSFDNFAVGGTFGGMQLQLEASMLSWRNTFSLDIVGETGSMHVDSLCKWGPSTFTLRKRILPSGRPTETGTVITSTDPTWEEEYRHFCEVCEMRQSNLRNDIWINSVLESITKQMK